jgi:hypothetical protein
MSCPPFQASTRVCAVAAVAFRQIRVPSTIWRLRDPHGVETRCTLVPRANDSCELRLEQGEQVIHTEQHEQVDAALLRANAMWIER